MRLYLYNRNFAAFFDTRRKIFQKNFPPPAARRCVSGRHGRRPGRGSVSHAGNDRLLLLSEPLPQRNSRQLRDHPVHDGVDAFFPVGACQKPLLFTEYANMFSAYIYFGMAMKLQLFVKNAKFSGLSA